MALRSLSKPAPGTDSTVDTDNTSSSLVLSFTPNLRRVLSPTSSTLSRSASPVPSVTSSSTASSTRPFRTTSMSSTSKLSFATSPSTNDVWGPAITAPSYSLSYYTKSPSITLPTTAAAVQTQGLDKLNSSGPHLSKSSQDALIATTVIGGTFIVALLMWAMYKRLQGATYAQILHVRPREPPTPTLTPTPMRGKFFTFPIYHDTRFSVHSTHENAIEEPSNGSKESAVVPPEVVTQFHEQNAYIQNTWKTHTVHMAPSQAPPPPPPKTQQTPEKDKLHRQTFLFDASPTVESIKMPEKARVSVRSISSTSKLTRASTGTARSDCKLSIAEATARDVFVTPPGSPISQRPLHDARDRWSWTNSQAPSTPRLGGPQRTSIRLSRSGIPHFRSVVSWVRGQSEPQRVDEEAPPIPTTTIPSIPAAKLVLKNQASKPTLAPRKLVKPRTPGVSHGKGPSLSSIFKSSSRPQMSSEQAGGQPSIEMHDRWNSG